MKTRPSPPPFAKLAAIALAWALSICPAPLIAQTAPCCTVKAVKGKVATQSGPWSLPATWGGEVPAANARVSIPAGIEVRLDVNPPGLQALFIEGTLRLAPRDTQITAGWIMVHGLFEIGTAAAPFPNRVTITLTGKNRAENIVCSGMAMGAKFISVMNGGRLVMHAPATTSWTRLGRDVAPGAATIVVDAANGWKAGDSIVVAPRVKKRGQTERRIIKAISGASITLDKPLSFDHSGTAPTIDGRRLEMRSEVGLLSRRILIQGDTSSTSLKFGGHVMIMAGGSAQLDGVGFVRMGQRNLLGRYPFHWHLLGSAAGQYIRNCAIDGSFQRGIVVHGTADSLVENNVVYATVGHNFSVEDRAATGNVLRGNLALENSAVVFSQATLAEQNDNQAANYWIRAARNTFTGNVAAASTAHGFWYDGVSDGPTDFSGNTAHSSYASSVKSDFVRDAGLQVTNVGDHTLEFSDSLFYQNGTGIWPAENGAGVFRDITVADHWGGFGVVMDTGGGFNTFENCLFVGRTRPPVRGERDSGIGDGGAMLIQYSGQAELLNPVFANYADNTLLSSNDVFIEFQAEYFLSGARLSGTSPGALSLPDGAISVLLDESFGQARGVYVAGGLPQLLGPEAERVGADEDGNPLYLRSQKVHGYAMMRTHAPGGDYFSLPWHSASNYVKRSDGLRYADDQINGYRMICGGEFTYELEVAPPHSQFFITLDNQGTPMPEGVPQTLIFSVPLAARPAHVSRIDELNEDTVPAPIPARLTPAANKATFEAAPLTSWYYDPATKRLHLMGDARWLVIQR